MWPVRPRRRRPSAMNMCREKTSACHYWRRKESDTRSRRDKEDHFSMLQGNRRRNSLDFLLVILLLPHISSTSISFSYRTCLPNIDLLHIEHSHQPVNSQSFRLVTRNFRLHLIYASSTDQIEFQFGNLNLTLPSSASFDYQFKAAIDYYHEIDTWHYVNITFDDALSKVFLSFNGDETRLIPLIDYPWKNATEQLNVKVLLDEQQNNVTCLLPHSGFEMPPSECSLNIKTCGE